MFTGIVECCGEVAAVESVETGARLSIDLPFAEELGVGGKCGSERMLSNRDSGRKRQGSF